MSFNRLKYDKCETEQYNRDTTGPGAYQNATPIICNNCYNDNPRIINQKTGVSVSGDKDWRFYSGPIDIESDLFNITRRDSKCPSMKFNPKLDCKVNYQGVPSGQCVVEEVNGEGLLKWWGEVFA